MLLDEISVISLKVRSIKHCVMATYAILFTNSIIEH